MCRTDNVTLGSIQCVRGQCVSNNYYQSLCNTIHRSSMVTPGILYSSFLQERLTPPSYLKVLWVAPTELDVNGGRQRTGDLRLETTGCLCGASWALFWGILHVHGTWQRRLPDTQTSSPAGSLRTKRPAQTWKMYTICVERWLTMYTSA